MSVLADILLFCEIGCFGGGVSTPIMGVSPNNKTNIRHYPTTITH